MGCVVEYNGKTYSFLEFKNLLKKGEIDNLINHPKFNDYAGSIYQDTRRVSEEGGIPERSQNNGSEDIQRDITQEKPESANIEQQTGKESDVEGEKEKVDIYADQPPTVLSHRGLQEVATEFGMDDVSKRQRKTDVQLRKDADNTIQSWKDKGSYYKNMEELVKDAEDGKVLSDEDRLILQDHLANEKQKLRDLGKSKGIHSDEFKAQWEKVYRLKKAGEKTRSEAGAALRVGENKSVADDSLEGYLEQEQDLNKGAPLTDNQITTAVNEHAKIEVASNEYKEKYEELQAKYAKLIAERELKKQAANTTKNPKKTHDDFVKERTKIVEDIREKLKKARQQTNVTVIPYANELIAIAPDVARLAKNLLEEGVTKLEDVVKNIHSQLKDDIQDIKEKDVQDILAGIYNEKKKTRSQLAEQMQDLRTQAQLINKYTSLLEGGTPKTEKAKRQLNKDIHELRQKIKGLEKEEKEANTRYKEEIAEEVKKLNSVKRRYEAELAKVKEELRTGNFEKEEKIPLLENAEVRKNFPEAFKDAQAARDALLKAKEERTIRMLKAEYADEKLIGKKGLRYLDELTNVGRVAKSSFDVSMPFRQGLWGVARELLTLPIEYKDGKLQYTDFRAQKMLGQQFGKMYKALVSEKWWRRIMADIHESPRYETAKEAGLSIAEPDSPSHRMREEVYGPSTIERIPVIGKSIPIGKEGRRIGGFVKASERAATAFVNQMKWDIYNDFVTTFESQGKTFKNSPKDYKAAAEYANQSVGRGKLKISDKYDLERANAITSKIFFSLRLQASRLQLLTNVINPMFYAKAPKELRVAYLKDATKFVALGLTTLAIAHKMGLSVGMNPFGTDFGKIKVGDTTYDIWGGFSQWAVFLMRMIGGQELNTKGRLKELGSDRGQHTRGAVGLRFMRSKLSPEMGFIANMMEGKDYIGQPVTLKSEALNFITPLQYADMKDLLAKDPSIQRALISYILMAHGVGINTYGSADYKDNSSSRTPVRRSTPQRQERQHR